MATASFVVDCNGDFLTIVPNSLKLKCSAPDQKCGEYVAAVAVGPEASLQRSVTSGRDISRNLSDMGCSLELRAISTITSDSCQIC